MNFSWLTWCAIAWGVIAFPLGLFFGQFIDFFGNDDEEIDPYDFSCGKEKSE